MDTGERDRLNDEGGDAGSGEFRGTSRFEVLSRLGGGGMGDVYEVFDRQRHARMALKRLRRPSPDALLRFKNEFRALEDLDHPNLVLLGELIEDGGQWFFTMELVPGDDFLAHVRLGDVPHAPSDDDFSSARTFEAGSAPEAAPARLLGAARAAAVTAVAPAHEARPPARFDEARLRTCLAQLASALVALHGAGKVHRDVKPGNIRVAPGPRLTLLDLGLVLDLGRDTLPERQIAGTADYMAPEQAAAAEVGPAADWYAVGVLLYQALTGLLPFAGPSVDVMAAKRHAQPPPPSALVAGVPVDLDRLAQALLCIDPAARPDGAAVLAALRGSGAPGGGPARALAPTMPPTFVGRDAELARLDQALADVAARGAPVTVFIEGESGVGKTAMVQRFVERLSFAPRDAGSAPPPLCLAGRCHEREAVPYKAVDGVIDALTRALARLPPAEVEALLPASIGLPAQVFPVLRRLGAAARRAAVLTMPRELPERRDLLFRALRELAAALAARSPLVLCIDDLQWADADSLALLRHLLAPPAAPPLLLLCTVRTTPDGAAAQASALGLPGEVRRLHLGGLGAADARVLAGVLAAAGGPEGAPAPASELLTRLASEAGGHPLFLSELLRWTEAHPEAPPAAVRLEQALWSRIIRLDPLARRVLELVTVAGAPLRLDVAARAAEAPDATAFTRWIATLRAAHLVRTSGPGDADLVEPYHDRVREAVRLHLPAEARAVCHRRLAVALETVGAAGEPEALAVHWLGAGDRHQAARHAQAAAAGAAAATAFERAARLYTWAVELADPEPAERARLLALAGDALVDAGRGPEAAASFLEAARHAPGELALELRRRAAEQLLRSGHLDAGLAAIAEVLDAIDMHLAPSPWRALASLLMTRTRVWARGRRFALRPEAEVPLAELTRIDACWSVAAGLAMVDTIRGTDFQARHLLLALRTGEPRRVCRALAAEGGFKGATNGKAAAAPLLAEARTLADALGDPRGHAYVSLARGSVELLEGHWRACFTELEGTTAHIRAHCTGLGWELHTARYYAVIALIWSGDLAEACRRINILRMESTTRGDRYAAATLHNGISTIHALHADDPAGGLEMAQRVVDDLPAFQFQHYWHMVSGVWCRLYAGEGALAIALVDERWAACEKAMIFRLPYIHAEALLLRGRALLAAAAQAAASERAALLVRAARDIQRLRRSPLGYAHAFATQLEAGLCLQKGEVGDARERLVQAARAFAGVDMELFRQASLHAHGRLVGGAEGTAQVAAAEAWLRAQEAKDPARLLRAFAPGPM